MGREKVRVASTWMIKKKMESFMHAGGSVYDFAETPTKTEY